MAATIKMVANRAGVSVATVSKYLNGGNVYEENAIKIQQAVDELDYKINDVARNLRTKKSYTVGVIASTIRSSFIAEIISTLQCALVKQGYSTIIMDYQTDKDLEVKQLDVLLKKKVDGIVLFPVRDESDIIHTIQKEGIPVVTVDNCIEGVECDSVVSNNRKAVYRAVNKLIELNHKRIGIITGPLDMYTAKERYDGYTDALRENGIEIDKDLIVTNKYDVESGYNGTKKLLSLENRPTAIITSNYNTSVGSLKALYEEGIEFPRDISFISVDEVECSCILGKPVSSINQDRAGIGEATAEIIVDRINGNKEDFPKQICIKAELDLKNSIRNL